jgi:predicted kinase
MINSSLSLPATEIVIITGPPCSGKSTYVNEHRELGDVMFDLDLIAAALTGSDPQHGNWPLGVRTLCLAVRDALIRRVQSRVDIPRLWIIASDTRHLPNYQTVKLGTPMNECLRRAELRGPEHRKIVEEWFSSHPGWGTH